MATAIVSVYTSEGFVIGADGLRRDALTGSIVSDKARKIFFAQANKTALSYAWAGATNLCGPDGTTLFNFLEESVAVAKAFASGHAGSLVDYVQRFVRTVYERLLVANGGEEFGGDLQFLPKGDELTRVLFVGYFDGAPYRMESAILHEQHKLAGLRFSEPIIAPVDFKVFSGSATMLRRFGPRLNDAPNTLLEATVLTRDYIQSCKDNQGTDLECRDIGGHIHIASVTPIEGFKWVASFEPIP